MEYVGIGYAGFQRQPGKVTVQAAIEDAISRVTGEDARVQGSGRTDAGAHALRQVIAFSSGTSLEPDILLRAINAHLPRTIAVTSVRNVGATFNPRFDASSRVYRYLIWNRPVRSPFWEHRAAHIAYRLDERPMGYAARALIGAHDFSAFVSSSSTSNPVRTMYRADCRREGDLVVVELQASGFMKQMVRSIVGTLIAVGAGQISVEQFGDVLRSRERSRAGDTAPAYGLYLADVLYGENTPADDEYHRRPSGLSAGLARFEEQQ